MPTPQQARRAPSKGGGGRPQLDYMARPGVSAHSLGHLATNLAPGGSRIRKNIGYGRQRAGSYRGEAKLRISKGQGLEASRLREGAGGQCRAIKGFRWMEEPVRKCFANPKML